MCSHYELVFDSYIITRYLLEGGARGMENLAATLGIESALKASPQIHLTSADHAVTAGSALCCSTKAIASAFIIERQLRLDRRTENGVDPVRRCPGTRSDPA